MDTTKIHVVNYPITSTTEINTMKPERSLELRIVKPAPFITERLFADTVQVESIVLYRKGGRLVDVMRLTPRSTAFDALSEALQHNNVEAYYRGDVYKVDRANRYPVTENDFKTPLVMVTNTVKGAVVYIPVDTALAAGFSVSIPESPREYLRHDYPLHSVVLRTILITAGDSVTKYPDLGYGYVEYKPIAEYMNDLRGLLEELGIFYKSDSTDCYVLGKFLKDERLAKLLTAATRAHSVPVSVGDHAVAYEYKGTVYSTIVSGEHLAPEELVRMLAATILHSYRRNNADLPRFAELRKEIAVVAIEAYDVGKRAFDTAEKFHRNRIAWIESHPRFSYSTMIA